MLLSEDRGGAEDERLPVVQRHGERCADGNLGLPEPDVTAYEPVHGPSCLEILLHRLDCLELILGLAIRERGLERLSQVGSEVERLAWRASPSRVQREKLARQLVHRRSRAALQVLPRLPAELGQGGCLPVRADVARDLPDLLVRDVQAIIAPNARKR